MSRSRTSEPAADAGDWLAQAEDAERAAERLSTVLERLERQDAETVAAIERLEARRRELDAALSEAQNAVAAAVAEAQDPEALVAAELRVLALERLTERVPAARQSLETARAEVCEARQQVEGEISRLRTSAERARVRAAVPPGTLAQTVAAIEAELRRQGWVEVERPVLGWRRPGGSEVLPLPVAAVAVGMGDRVALAVRAAWQEVAG